MVVLIDVFTDKNTWIHRLNPKTKILFWVIAITMAAIINNPILNGPYFLLIFSIFLSSRPPRWLIKIALLATGFFIFTYSYFWVLTTREGNIVFWIITDWGLWVGLGYGLRTLCGLMSLILLFTTTRQSEMVSSFEELGLPYSICFVIASAMRFVPAVLGEWTTIRDAQKCRGAAVVYGGLIFTRKFWATIKDVVTIAIPLFAGVLRISSQVSLAVESKAFDVEGKTRTQFYEFPMKQFDWAFLIVSIFIGAVLLYFRFFVGIGWI